MRIAILSWLFSLFALTGFTYAEEPRIEKLLDLLKGKDLITPEEEAALRTDIAKKEEKNLKEKKWFNVLAGRAITISGYTQLRYRHLEEGGKDDSFDIRRLRLVVSRDITSKFNYRTQIDFEGGKGTLLDAMIGYKLIDHYLTVTGGQYKIPFSQENLTSSPNLETIYRSQVVEALVSRTKDVIGSHNGRDIGIKASGDFIPLDGRYLLNYAVGVFNGAGINTGDNNEKKDFVVRVGLNPIKGLDIGFNYYNGEANLNGEDQNRDRIGADFTYIYKSLSLRGEYIFGEDGETDKDGWYLQTGYLFLPKKLQGVVKYDTFDPDKDVSRNETDVYTIGVNYYFNKWAFIQTNYEIKNERGKEIDNDALTAQFTLKF